MCQQQLSLTEARTRIKRIKPILKRLIANGIRLKLQKEVRIHYRDPFQNYMETLRRGKELHRTQLEIFSLLNQIAELGAIVKDARLGIIDFSAKYDGRTIRLCYRYGESTINWWHENDEGFTNRKSITLLGESIDPNELT